MKRAVVIMLMFSFLVLSWAGTGYSLDRKEAIKQYLSGVNPILTNVQVTTRNISQKLLPLSGVVKQMQSYINSLHSLTPPDALAKQHKMMMLSFKKIRLGFFELSRGNKQLSVILVKRGAVLLKAAVGDIIELSKKEGIIKENPGQKNK
jgi:hypothetical protein